MNCTSCKINIIRKNFFFYCFNCLKNKIYRCEKCRKNLIRYTCKNCGFEGP